jgi:hypothetical protein
MCQPRPRRQHYPFRGHLLLLLLLLRKKGNQHQNEKPVKKLLRRDWHIEPESLILKLFVYYSLCISAGAGALCLRKGGLILSYYLTGFHR